MLYGALTNLYFRYYRLELGDSTTATGRKILKHQCRTVAYELDGNYDIEFPLYDLPATCVEKGYTEAEALLGPVFQGKHQSESVIYGDSVTGDTKIETDRGCVDISTLFEHISSTDGNKEYCNLDNRTALTYDEANNVTTYKPIKYVMRHKTTKQLYRVWINNLQYVDVTEDHSLIRYRNSAERTKATPSMFAEATVEDLQRSSSSLIYLKTLPRRPELLVSKLKLTTLELELLGFVYGDGYVDATETGGILLSIGNQDLDEVQLKLLQPLQAAGSISSWTLKPNGHDVQINGAKLRRRFREILYNTGAKKVPTDLLRESDATIASFVRGWFSADGWINSDNSIGLCNIDKTEIELGVKLLHILGISSTYFVERTENSHKGKFNGTYSHHIHVKSKREFKEKVGFIQDRKQTRISLATLNRMPKDVDFTLVRVYKIESLPPSEQYVYDIEVGDTHMFFANNILVHNTDSCYFKTHATDTETAIRIADAVAVKVNASFQPFMQNNFLCSDKFDNLIKAGREIVSDCGIFVTKKRYMLHLVDDEGSAVDKLKVMGLDTKKTILPKPIAKTINNSVEKFLKGSTWEELEDEIVEYKSKLIEEGQLLKYGIPGTVYGLEDYYSQYLKLGDSSKLRLPGHVRASILYNQCIDEYNDRVNPKITSGTKIRKYYLKNPVGKFKSIAIPTDLVDLPKWFIENYPIDNKMMTEKLVDNPIKNIVKAIGKEPPTKQTVLDRFLVSYDD